MLIFSWHNMQMHVNVCACKNHTREQCIMIRELLAIKGLNRIRCLHLEDEMPKPVSHYMTTKY